MCKNQERIIDQFAGYTLPQCIHICAIAFVCSLLTFLHNAHSHTNTRTHTRTSYCICRCTYVFRHRLVCLFHFNYVLWETIASLWMLLRHSPFAWVLHFREYYEYTTTIYTNDDGDNNNNNKDGNKRAKT